MSTEEMDDSPIIRRINKSKKRWQREMSYHYNHVSQSSYMQVTNGNTSWEFFPMNCQLHF